MFMRSGFNYDRDAVSVETGLVCDPEGGMAQQQFAAEVDINTIVRRFGLTGELPENPRMPMSGDFTTVVDFQSAMQAVRVAEEAFMEFPAEVRARFANDPQRMISFLSEDANRDEAMKLGFLKKPVEKTRDVVAAVDELAAKLVPVKPVV